MRTSSIVGFATIGVAVVVIGLAGAGVLYALATGSTTAPRPAAVAEPRAQPEDPAQAWAEAQERFFAVPENGRYVTTQAAIDRFDAAVRAQAGHASSYDAVLAQAAASIDAEDAAAAKANEPITRFSLFGPSSQRECIDDYAVKAATDRLVRAAYGYCEQAFMRKTLPSERKRLLCYVDGLSAIKADVAAQAVLASCDAKHT